MIRFALAALFVLTSAVTAAERPNILFAIADDWGFGHAGAYGCKWVNTPAFDRVAKEGILFTRAYTPNAKCAPSRAIILTGRNSWQLEQAGNHMCIFPAKFKGFVEALKDNDYFVGTTGKGWGPGIAKDANGKNRQMTGVPYSKRKAKPPAGGISNNDYASNFEDFLADAPEGKAWCFWYGTTEPHRGYQYGVGVKLGGKKLSDIDRVPSYWPDNDVTRNDMLDYAFEVEHYDNHLGRIIAAIEKAGQLENTIIVATSDHGMPFPRCKGQAYESSNHIPLAIRWPSGIKGKGRVVKDYVKFTDLAPTFVEAAGLKWSDTGMQPTSGDSLFDIFASAESGQVNPKRDHVLIGKERHDIGRPNQGGYPIRGIIRDNMLFLKNYETSRWPAGNPETGYLNCDGSPTKTDVLEERRKDPKNAKHWELCFGKRPVEEFFNVSADPDCVKNLAESQKHAALATKFLSEMEDKLREQGDPRMFGKGSVFDEYPYSSGATDRFFERYMSGENLRAGWVSPTDFENAPLD